MPRRCGDRESTRGTGGGGVPEPVWSVRTVSTEVRCSGTIHSGAQVLDQGWSMSYTVSLVLTRGTQVVFTSRCCRGSSFPVRTVPCTEVWCGESRRTTVHCTDTVSNVKGKPRVRRWVTGLLKRCRPVVGAGVRFLPGVRKFPPLCCAPLFRPG